MKTTDVMLRLLETYLTTGGPSVNQPSGKTGTHQGE